VRQNFFGKHREEADPNKIEGVKSWLKRITGDDSEEGQGLVEYALILLLVAIVVIAILIVLGPQVGSMFSAVSKGIS
jgi:pilus assembly protein Flp/PilA